MQSQAASDSRPSRSSDGDNRGWWFAAAMTVFLGCTTLALLQDKRPNPFVEYTPKDRAWWFERPEGNPELRTPYLPVRIREVRTSHDGATIWAVGADDSVFESTDDGRTWKQLENTETAIRPKKAAEGAG